MIKLLVTLLTACLNFFRYRKDNHLLNTIWVLCDNALLRILISGREESHPFNGTHYHGLGITFVVKGLADCTNGYKASKPFRFWLMRCHVVSYNSPLRKLALWRKWNDLASHLKTRFHYLDTIQRNQAVQAIMFPVTAYAKR